MPVDWMSGHTYNEFAVVFLLIIAGTITFAYYTSVPWLTPFVLLSAAVVLAGYGLAKHLNRAMQTKKTDDPPPEQMDALLAGGIWIAWMTYGVVFKSVPPILHGVAAYIHGIVIVAIVMLSHSRADVRRDGKWATGLLVIVVLLLFLPHPDTISSDIDPLILFTKIVVFYFLFAIAEVALKLELEARVRRDDPPSPVERVYAIQVQVVQTAWILLTIWQLLPIVIFQVAIIGAEIRTHMRDRNTEVLLPVATKRTKVSKPPAKGPEVVATEAPLPVRMLPRLDMASDASYEEAIQQAEKRLFGR